MSEGLLLIVLISIHSQQQIRVQHRLKTCCVEYHPTWLLIFFQIYSITIVDTHINMTKVSGNDISTCTGKLRLQAALNPLFLIFSHSWF